MGPCHRMEGFGSVIFQLSRIQKRSTCELKRTLNHVVWFVSTSLEIKKPFRILYPEIWASLVAQMVKNLPAMQETWVQSLGQEDPLERGMVTHSSILAWRIPWTEEPGGLQSMGLQRVGHDWETNTHTQKYTGIQDFFSYISNLDYYFMGYVNPWSRILDTV